MTTDLKKLLFFFLALISFSFVLWHGHLREIRCSHGLGLYAFFLFLRWLFLLNILVSIISAFVWLPFLLQYSLTELKLFQGDSKWVEFCQGANKLCFSRIFFRSHARDSVPALSVGRMVCLSVTLFSYRRLQAVLALLLLPNCWVGLYHHCLYRSSHDIVYGLVEFEP